MIFRFSRDSTISQPAGEGEADAVTGFLSSNTGLNPAKRRREQTGTCTSRGVPAGTDVSYPPVFQGIW
jgi:hypothetical protein